MIRFQALILLVVGGCATQPPVEEPAVSKGAEVPITLPPDVYDPDTVVAIEVRGEVLRSHTIRVQGQVLRPDGTPYNGPAHWGIRQSWPGSVRWSGGGEVRVVDGRFDEWLRSYNYDPGRPAVVEIEPGRKVLEPKSDPRPFWWEPPTVFRDSFEAAILRYEFMDPDAVDKRTFLVSMGTLVLDAPPLVGRIRLLTASDPGDVTLYVMADQEPDDVTYIRGAPFGDYGEFVVQTGEEVFLYSFAEATKWALRVEDEGHGGIHLHTFDHGDVVEVDLQPHVPIHVEATSIDDGHFWIAIAFPAKEHVPVTGPNGEPDMAEQGHRMRLLDGSLISSLADRARAVHVRSWEDFVPRLPVGEYVVELWDMEDWDQRLIDSRRIAVDGSGPVHLRFD